MFFVFTTAKAQFFCEDFEYSPGDTIGNHNWVAFSGLGVNPVIVTNDGLEHTCYGPTFGNAVQLKSTGEDSYKFLPVAIDTGSIYVSMLVNVSAAQTGDFFFHLGDSVVNNSKKIARIYAKAITGGFQLGLSKNNENPVYASSSPLNFGVTYLVVLKYQFVAGSDNDLVSLFVFPDQAQACPACSPEPQPNVGPLGNGENDLPNIGKLVLCQGAGAHGPTLLIDAICVDKVFCNSALPVELSAFFSIITDNEVKLSWQTSSEINNREFLIERKNTAQWVTVGSVSGHGTSNVGQNYQFIDRGLLTGSYQYRLKQIDFNGNYEYHTLNEIVTIGVPDVYQLKQNYPNPFNPTTTIDYMLPQSGHITLEVYDNIGRQVAQLVNEYKTAGYYQITFNGSNLGSGIYYYRLTTSNFSETRKMLLVK